MKTKKQKQTIHQQIVAAIESKKDVDVTEELLVEMDRTLARLKVAFEIALDEMGQITKQDIDYNIDLVSRLMYKKFGK